MDCNGLSPTSGVLILFMLEFNLSCDIVGFYKLSKVTLYACTFESIEYLNVKSI